MGDFDEVTRLAFRRENQRQLELAKRSRTPRTRKIQVVEDGKAESFSVIRQGAGPIATPIGQFYLLPFIVNDKWQKYSVVFKGTLNDDLQPQLQNAEEFLLRIDSGCETGQLFLDRTCECREQLHMAMAEIEERGEGAVINIPAQDGRGMGLPFKLATLRLQQEFGVDTVQAAAMLEPVQERDTRTYGGAVSVLKFMGIEPPTKILLATNNHKKTQVFVENGYELVQHSIVIPATEFTKHHLEAKQHHLGHRDLLPPVKDEALQPAYPTSPSQDGGLSDG